MQSNSKDDENVSKTPTSDHYEQNGQHITEDPKGTTPSEANVPDDITLSQKPSMLIQPIVMKSTATYH